MSKTLSIKKISIDSEAAGFSPGVEVSRIEVVEDAAAAVAAYTEDQLLGMLRDMRLKNGTIVPDATMDLPVFSNPEDVARVAALPPAELRSSAPAPQLPGKAHGQFGIGGIALLVPQLGDAPPVSAANPLVNPATGSYYTQIGPRPVTQISPPPSRRFDGR